MKTVNSLINEVDFLAAKVEMLEREMEFYANHENYQIRKVVPIKAGLKTTIEIPIVHDHGYRARLVLGKK